MFPVFDSATEADASSQMRPLLFHALITEFLCALPKKCHLLAQYGGLTVKRNHIQLVGYMSNMS